MNRTEINANYPLSAVPLKKFAELTGKTHDAVKEMAKQRKIPIIEYKNPESKTARAGEIWVSLTAFNRGMDEAHASLSKEQRDAWLLWIGL